MNYINILLITDVWACLIAYIHILLISDLHLASFLLAVIKKSLIS